MFRCKCGWSIYSDTPKTVTCGKCGRLVHCYGLGDRVERTLSFMGGRLFKKYWKLFTGKNCGCAKRQAKLNRFGFWLNKKVQYWTTRVFSR